MCTVCSYRKFPILFASILLVSSLLTPAVAASRSLTEIEQELAEKRAVKEQVDQELQALQEDLSAKQARENQAESEVDKIEAEIERIEAEIAFNQKQLDQLASTRELLTLEREERERRQDKQVELSYQSWKSGENINQFFAGGNLIRTTVYNQSVTTKAHGGILGLATELQEIQSEYARFESDSGDLQEQIDSLAEQKAMAQAKLDEAKQARLATAADVSGVRSEQSSLQTAINELSAEQKQLQEQENQLTKGEATGGTQQIVSGEYYFSGTGRDLYQGHGVGMSQYGALGAALQGWDYKQILEFYFPGTSVGQNSAMPSRISVNGHGRMDMETYVAGAGEVPDLACEDAGVDFNPNNFWYCWPKQAILAQVVAFRTFGALRSGGIATDTTAQVYKGGTAKQWAADLTTGESVNYQGSIANVFYSSDNNQGYGNANNDTVWSNFSGNGSAIPYLRSVNDNAFAYKSQWTNWAWRTNSYTNGELNNFIAWSASSGKVSGSTRSFMSGVRSDIGQLQSLGFKLDPSRRVDKLVLNGDKGSREIAGWLWKSLWNVWVGNEQPSGEKDYIYSLTFNLDQGN